MNSQTRLRYQVFAREYATNGFNATQAALTAGYSARTAKQQGQQLLTRVDVQQLITEHTQPVLDRYAITAEKTLATLAVIAFGDRLDLWLEREADGSRDLKPFSELTAEERLLIDSVEFEKETFSPGKDAIAYKHKTKVKGPDRLKALEMLMKYMGLLPTTGKVRINVDNRKQELNFFEKAGLSREEILRIAQLPID